MPDTVNTVNASDPVNSEMPRLRHYLKVTFLTWLPLVAIASALGGILAAKALSTNAVGSFLGGMVMVFWFVGLPSLFMVAVYVLATLKVEKRGIAGALLRVALAIGSVVLVIGLILGFNLLTSDETHPWWWIRSNYQGWLVFALCLTPVLVIIHGRIK